MNTEITRRLVDKGLQYLDSNPSVPFTEKDNPEINHQDAERLIKDIGGHPHIFVLGCVMDSRVKSERAWAIPYHVSKHLGGTDFSTFANAAEEVIVDIFTKNELHMYSSKMGKRFFKAIQDIANWYEGDASRIWNDCPTSGTVVRRFLRFDGVGPKIATMATNILMRDFGVPMKDKHCIDVSPDRHIKRLFWRLGLTDTQDDLIDIVYAARDINPEYPGVIDLPLFLLGRTYCHEKKPDCGACWMNDICPRNGL